MGKERTPPTGAIRQAFIRCHPFSATTEIEERMAEFDRWLKLVRAETLREAAEGFQEELGANAANPGPKYIVGWLNNRAAQEEATGEHN